MTDPQPQTTPARTHAGPRPAQGQGAAQGQRLAQDQGAQSPFRAQGIPPEPEAIAAKAAAKARRLSLLRFTHDATPDYQAGWFHRDLAAVLETVTADTANRKARRVMLFVPPRHGKSRMVSVCWPAWHLGHHPGHEFISGSYSKSLATRHSAEARALLQEEWYRQAFPNTAFDPASKAKDDWRVVQVESVEGFGKAAPSKPTADKPSSRRRGGYKGVGVGSGATGRGAHIAIVDDPFADKLQAYSAAHREKVWDWYNWVLSSRLAPGGSVVLVMTRWHKDDLAGRLIERDGIKGQTRAADGSEGQWEVIRYPAVAEEDEPNRKKGEALFPERYPADCEVFRAAQKERGAWLALYQQRPTAEEGGLFKRDWWRRFKVGDLPARFDKVMISVDANAKRTVAGSFACLQVWGRLADRFYLLDQKRGRWSYPRLKDELRRARHALPFAPMLIEDKAAGQNAIEELEALGGIHKINPKGDKEARAAVYADRVEAGAIWIPDESEQPWVRDFVDEFADFPASTNDDQVDCFSQAMAYWPDFQYRMGVLQGGAGAEVPWALLPHGDDDDEDASGADLDMLDDAQGVGDLVLY